MLVNKEIIMKTNVRLKKHVYVLTDGSFFELCPGSIRGTYFAVVLTKHAFTSSKEIKPFLRRAHVFAKRINRVSNS